MNQFKRSQVIILPTENNTVIVLNPSTNKLSIPKELIIGTDSLKRFKEVGFIPQHIYIISDDEIKEGDWRLDIRTNKIYQSVKQDAELYDTSFRKKIIVTTDTSLKIEGKLWKTTTNLPQPSKQFIEKYVESYNKGEVITDVLVEYEDYIIKYNTKGITNIKSNRLKVNPKDNTITIKKLKDSWSREEVIILMKKSFNKGVDAESFQVPLYFSSDKWIEENL